MQDNIDKTMRMNYLFDFYQGLLTDKQRNYLERYYLEDESLSEIAEAFLVSRQAVYDNIKRTDELLEDYEVKLGLYRKFEERQQLITEMKDMTDSEALIEKLEQLEMIE
ncbi:putative DNA-binding protein [Macrococcus carouselicus]|uniref:UPF0122 protein ERX40_02215 n=1 Tax=Macrococcus carouselicus TaxID=69969 RepID=A0A9Q8CIQ0_9STAP|nr:putative DNA-binding protein [Macrococcus carouselicus]TDM04004.1 putative DNA-binding protein [Macrococcus carouselicus]